MSALPTFINVTEWVINTISSNRDSGSKYEYRSPPPCGEVYGDAPYDVEERSSRPVSIRRNR